MVWEVVAANVAPGVKPPFLKHSQNDNKTEKSTHIGSNVYKKLQNLPMLEVQDGVACKGCVEQ